jgi:hypothetical protein
MKIDEISAAIAKKKAPWIAKDHPFLKLADKELVRRTGVVVDKENLEKLRKLPKPDLARILADTMKLRDKPIAYKAAKKILSFRQYLDTLQVAELAELDYAVVCWAWGRDWRSVGGRNCVTPVKDQGYCGSCTSFGTIATLESMVLIERNIETDLSEAELHFCGHGVCWPGWWPIDAVNYVKSHGVAHESCFPYQDHNMPCTTCSLRDGEAITVSTDVAIFNIQQRKDYLWAIGPMIAVFEVYPDFWGYGSGVYTPTVPPSADHPLHCVEVIGYSPCQKAWICKNSWGAGWGDNGFFRIAYGQCDIDTTYPFIGISNTKWWKP